jgi:uncharacterized membrane protein
LPLAAHVIKFDELSLGYVFFEIADLAVTIDALVNTIESVLLAFIDLTLLNCDEPVL